MRIHHRASAVAVMAVVIISGCAQVPGVTTDPTVPGPSPAATTRAAPKSAVPSSITIASPPRSPAPRDPLSSPSVDGRFVVDDTGRRLAMRCWGDGSPTVFLESGGGAISEFTGSSLVRRVAAETRVCLYDRAGITPSDPAPDRAREAEDVVADFHALVAAAGIGPPFVLFGRSFGGMIVTFYAATHPEDVAGVVVFDSPAPSPTMTVADFPEGVWDYPGNVERLNVLTGFENRFGKTPVHLAAPLILISPTAGESRPDDRYWLQTSDRSKQIVLQGGTDVIDQQADRIAGAILSLVPDTPSVP